MPAASIILMTTLNSKALGLAEVRPGAEELTIETDDFCKAQIVRGGLFFMKPNIIAGVQFITLIALLGCTLAGPPLFAQTPAADAVASTVAGIATPSAGAYLEGERGANWQEWRQVAQVTNTFAWTNSLGRLVTTNCVVTRTNRAYVEIADGKNYWRDGRWSVSSELISILPQGGAAATAGQHQAYFPGDIYSGAIQVVMPDGTALNSRPLAIAYDDGNSTVFLAVLTNSVGYLISSNQIVYPNAFMGLQADLLYTYTRRGLEQNLIIRQQPRPPEYFDMQGARLQLLTEFLSPPTPVVTPTLLPAQGGVALTDQTLDFGAMSMVPGRAFLVGTAADDPGVQVGKSWVSAGGRQFLVEEVPVPAIADALAQLPLVAVHNRSGGGARWVAAPRMLPPLRSVGRSTNIVQLASRRLKAGPGLVLDYTILNSNQSGYTFSGNTTFFISGNATMNSATFEGGAVLKYASNVTLQVNGPVTWLATSYQPVTLLAKDDNSVGAVISGSTGGPSTNHYASIALGFNGLLYRTNLVLSHLRVANAQTALALYASPANTLYDTLKNVQLVNCGIGVAATNTGVQLYNALLWNVQTNFIGSNASGDVEQVTVDTAGLLNQNLPLNLTNCLLAAVANYGNCTTQNVSICSGGAGVFTNVGAGFHYLAAGNGCQQVGTSNINPGLAADLATMTTWPPVMLATNFAVSGISSPTNLGPQAVRDASLTPDLGYHYDPLDWVWTNLTVGTGVTLTLTNGVAIGYYGPYCLTLNYNNTLFSLGTPNQLNHLAPYQAVQEQSQGSGNGLLASGSHAPVAIYLRFTDLPMLGGAGNSYLDGSSYLDEGGYFSQMTIQDCTLRDGALWLNPSAAQDFGNPGAPQVVTLGLTNNVFQRGNVSINRLAKWSIQNYECVFSPTSSGNGTLVTPFTLWLCNNLFWNGTVSFTYESGAMGGQNTYISGPPGPGWYYNTSSCGDFLELNPVWNFDDNLFAGVSPSVSVLGEYPIGWNSNGNINLHEANDAFYNSSSTWLNGGAGNGRQSGGNVTVTSLTFATSFLGSWYLGSSSPNLINHGDVAAGQRGLYEYTVQASQVKETNSLVDIGFHYVATDASGNPLATLWTGIPDYLADSNGNGALEAWELLYFGQLGLDPYATDDQGHTLLYDYQNNTGPGLVNFVPRPGGFVFTNGMNIFLSEPKPAAVIP